ncbi:MAG: hypothetical protein AAGI68_01875 [Planctomycetota bacterium]
MRPTPQHISKMLEEASKPAPLDHPLPRRALHRITTQLRDLASVLQPIAQHIFRPLAVGTRDTAIEIQQHARRGLAHTPLPAVLPSGLNAGLPAKLPAILRRHLPTAAALLLLVGVFVGMTALRPDPVVGAPSATTALNANPDAVRPITRAVAYHETQHAVRSTPTTPPPTTSTRRVTQNRIAVPPIRFGAAKASIDTPKPVTTNPSATASSARTAPLAAPQPARVTPIVAAPSAATPPAERRVVNAMPGKDLPPVVFLIDASGSMVDVLPKAHGWLTQQLADLPTGQPFTVILFSADTLAEPRHPDGPSRGLRPANASTRAAALRWLTTTGPQIAAGRSDPQAALGTALAYAPGTLVIASDDGFAQRSMWGTGPGLHAAIDQLVASQSDPQTLTIDTAQFLYRSVDGTLEALANRFAGTYTFVPAPPVNTTRQLIPLY